MLNEVSGGVGLKRWKPKHCKPSAFFKFNFLRFSIYLFILCLLTSTAIGGTFAKYKSLYETVDYGKAAPWRVTVRDVNVTAAGDASNLVTYYQDSRPVKLTVNVFNNLQNNSLTNQTAIRNVNGVDTEVPIIAPGSSGSFTLEIVNASSVATLCTIDLSEEFGGVALEYRYSENESFSSVKTKEVEINYQETKNVTVYWRWPFEGVQDSADNGKIDGKNPCTITVTVSAQQKVNVKN